MITKRLLAWAFRTVAAASICVCAADLNMASAADSGKFKASATNGNFKNLILNGTCCVPNLSSGYRPVKLDDGRYKKTDENGNTISIQLGDKFLFGTMDSKPVAIAVLYDCEGGSGNFGSLMLYEMIDGRAVTVGSRAIGDRAMVRSLTMVGDKVKVVSEETLGPQSGKQNTQVLKRADFEPAECLEQPLPPAMLEDIKALMNIYNVISPQQPELSAEKKQKALEICQKHENDRSFFERAFRLTLSAEGWGPGPTPLIYDAAGNPSFKVDDNIAKFHHTVNLSAKN